MKPVLVTLTALPSVLLVVLVLAALAGYPPGYLWHAPAVATGIGAKLLCSSRYVSGFDEERGFADLIQYSPILEALTVRYDDLSGSVMTDLYGFARTTASYRDGLGCAIDYPDFGDRRPALDWPSPSAQAPWPAGDQVPEPDPALQSLLQSMLARDNDQGLQSRAFLVVKDGTVLAEAYADGISPQTPLLGWSMSKSLISVMLGNLEYRNLLDIDSSPGFSEWQQDVRRRIRVRDLLTMTDGLTFIEDYQPGDDVTAMLFTEPDGSAYALTRPLAVPPGTLFHYSSGTANLLSYLHHLRTGDDPVESLTDYMTHIHIPMGFQHAIFERDASGVLVGSSYLHASARDWARLGQLMLDNGVINGQRLVRTDWVARATAPNSSRNEKAYGYQWWLNQGDAELRWPSLPAEAYAAQGNRQQWLMVIPSAGLVIVRLGWTSGGYPVDARFAELLTASRKD